MRPPPHARDPFVMRCATVSKNGQSNRVLV
jgi:hypothetical protein